MPGTSKEALENFAHKGITVATWTRAKSGKAALYPLDSS